MFNLVHIILNHNCLMFIGFSSSQPPGYGLINDQESNSSLNQLLNLAREEVGQQISHYVGNSQHSNSAPSVIQAHTNTQSNKQLGQTNSSVIKELREFLSDYSRRNNQSMGPSPVTIDDQQDRLLKICFIFQYILIFKN